MFNRGENQLVCGYRGQAPSQRVRKARGRTLYAHLQAVVQESKGVADTCHELKRVLRHSGESSLTMLPWTMRKGEMQSETTVWLRWSWNDVCL